jgi:hypothetical protein
MNRPAALFTISLLAAALGACGSSTTFQGDPPLSNAPNKAMTYLKPYEKAVNTIVGPGVLMTTLVVGPHFMPGACDGLWNTGDRKIVCDLRERYWDEPKQAKADPNARFACVRTLGGGTECTEIGQ